MDWFLPGTVDSKRLTEKYTKMSERIKKAAKLKSSSATENTIKNKVILKSMTGYGACQQKSAQGNLEISLRAVNGRFLETRFHLSRDLMVFESEFKKIIEKYLIRGTVDIFVSRRLEKENQTEVKLHRELAKKYWQALQTLAKDLKITAPLHLESVIRLPEVLKIEETSVPVSEAEKKQLLQVFEKACQAIDLEREREGLSLQKDLLQTLQMLQVEVDKIQTMRDEANQQLAQRFEQRIKARLQGMDIDASRLSQEIVIQLEKADINEELCRLKEHIQNYRQLLSEGPARGKKLDFYTQELLREVNTIGSKSSVSKLTESVVEAKTLIERLREQVQNVE